MNHKRKIVRSACLLLIVGVLCIVADCAPKDPSAVALKVAREWSTNNVDEVAGNIANLVAKDNPVAKMAASMAIKQEISKRIAWEFSNPQKIGEEQYGVVATAYTVISVPVLGDYKISVNYNLEIDTKIKQVVAANMDASTFSLVKQ